jgi:hypothetical protein
MFGGSHLFSSLKFFGSFRLWISIFIAAALQSGDVPLLTLVEGCPILSTVVDK